MARFARARVDPLTLRLTWESLALHLLSGGRLFGRFGVVRERPPTALDARVPLKPCVEPGQLTPVFGGDKGWGVVWPAGVIPAPQSADWLAPLTYEEVIQPGHMGFEFSVARVSVVENAQYHATRDTFRIVRSAIEARGLQYDPVRTNCIPSFRSEPSAMFFRLRLHVDGCPRMGALFSRRHGRGRCDRIAQQGRSAGPGSR
jgi:hypothetical protein